MTVGYIQLYIQDICHVMVMKVSCESYAHPFKCYLMVFRGL